MASDDVALHAALADLLYTFADSKPLTALVVAFSGGLDSTVLLDIAWRHCQRHPHLPLTAVHIHHGLSPNADQWQAHCANWCHGRHIAFVSESVIVRPAPRQSLEAEARQRRYVALEKHLPPGGALLTGHHLDDQVETLLLMLKRGAGPKGLAAMPAASRFGPGQLLRPLLAASREQLREYATRHKLSWIDDESNRSEVFDRNFLRHQIIPRLRARWPGFEQCAARSAALCGEQQQLVDELAQIDLLQAQRADDGLSVSDLTALNRPRLNNLLRYWLARHGAPMPSRAQLQQVADTLLHAREDANPCLQWMGWQLRRYRQGLYVLAPQPKRLASCLSWQGQARLTVAPGIELLFHRARGLGIRLPGPGEAVTVRFALPGSQRCHPDDRIHSTTLKQLYKERGIPPWLRGQIPFIFYGDRLVAAQGYWIEHGQRAPAGEMGLQITQAA